MSQQFLTIEVVEPNGGERLQPGQQYVIRWRSTGAVAHTVKLSTNGGADYTDISPQLSGAAQSFNWTVPQLETSRARIRVAARDTSNNRLTDDSDDDFSVSVLTAPAPVITSIVPNTGPLAGGTLVTIEGQNFVNGCVAKFGGTDAQTSFQNDRKITAITPRQTVAGLVNVRVVNPDKQVDVVDNGFRYVAEEPVTIEVAALAGGPFQGGNDVTVTWQTRGNVSFHVVRISLDNGNSFTEVSNDLPATARSHTFKLPNPTTPEVQAVIRVAAKDALRSPIARGDGPSFRLRQAPPPAINVTMPDGGEFLVGQEITAVWQTSGQVSFHSVRIAYDGNNFEDLTANDLDGNARTFKFRLPQTPARASRAVVRVVGKDAARAQVARGDSKPFDVRRPTSLRVSEPAGGTFQEGQRVTARWQTDGPASSHSVGLTFDGTNVTSLTTNDLAGNVQSFAFNLPAPPTPSAQAFVVVRAKDERGVQVARADSAPFTLLKAPTPTTVNVAPQTGGPFQAGQQITVRWQTGGPVSSHEVRLSYDGAAPRAVTQTDLGAAADAFNFALPAPPAQQSQAVVTVIARDAARREVAAGVGAPFTVRAAQQPSAPTLTSISPPEGATTGGRAVTVKGDNFAQGAALFLGGVVAENVRVVDPQTITAKTPARNTAGEVNVRVQNPDQKDATLPRAFKYNDAPVINDIEPNSGPVNTEGAVIVISGRFFQPDVKVFFKEALAVVRSRSAEGDRLEVIVPASGQVGPVRVKVLNPDEGEARRADGYTYLGPRQQQRTRIRKVTPAVLLEGEERVVTVYGNNLHQARASGTFFVRAATPFKVERTRAEPGRDPTTQEETLTFKLRVTTKSGNPLGALQRVLVEVVADRRPKAALDGLAESFATITVLPKALPVAVSFTASVTRNKTSVVAVAGANMKGARLAMDERAGVTLEHQFSDDNVAVALVSVGAEADGADLAVKLLDPKTSQPVLAPMRVKIRGGQAARQAGGGGAPVPLDDEPDVDVGEMTHVPDQVAFGPSEGNSVGYNLSVTPGTPDTFSGTPDPARANLVVGAAFTVLDETFEFPLFSYARQLALFDKGGKQITAGDLFTLRKGTLRKIRNLTLLLALDVRLVVNVRVVVFVGFNPFPDFDSPEPFLGPFAGRPSLPANAFGVVLLGFGVFLSGGVLISLYAGLIAPRTRAKPVELVFKTLAAFLFGVTFDADRKSLTLDGRFSFTIRGTINPVAPVFASGLKQVGTGFGADRLLLGFDALYFAEEAGEFCTTFDYGASPDFRLEFRGVGGDELTFLPLPTTLELCVRVKTATQYRIVRIEPPEIALDAGDVQPVKAIARLVGDDGAPLDNRERELEVGEVRFAPEDPATRIFRAEKTATPEDPVVRWRVFGLERGAGRLFAYVTTEGRGNSFFPRARRGFFLPADDKEDAGVGGEPANVSVTSTAAEFKLILQTGPGKPIGDAWVYLKDAQGRILLLRTGGDGEVKRHSGRDITMPDQYNGLFITTARSNVRIYYTRGALPLNDRRVNENEATFFEVTIPAASETTSGRLASRVTLPDIRLNVSTPRELSLWPLLFEPPAESAQTSKLLQGAALFSGGVVKGSVMEKENANKFYGESEERPRERGLVVRGVLDRDARSATVQVLASDANQSNIPLRLKPTDTATVNEVPVKTKLEQGVKTFEATLYFGDPTTFFSNGQLVQILVRQDLGPGRGPVIGSFACLPVGLQVALVQDKADGKSPQPLPTESDEIVIVDFRDSPSGDILSQGRARRMVSYPMEILKRPGSELPFQPQMPMWMAELHLVGLSRRLLEALLTRRRRRFKPEDAPLTLAVKWQLLLGWHGSERTVGRYSQTFTRQNTANGLSDVETLTLRLRPDADLLDGVEPGGRLTNALTPAPAPLAFPVATRRKASAAVEQKRPWGRRKGTPQYESVVVEWQPAVVDAGGNELIRGGDGALSIESLTVDGAEVDRGMLFTKQGAIQPPKTNEVARTPDFRVPGHANLLYNEAFILSDFIVRQTYDALVANLDSNPAAGILSPECWKQTVRQFMVKESGVRHFQLESTRRKEGRFGIERDMPTFGTSPDYGICQLAVPKPEIDMIWNVVANLIEGVKRLMQDKANAAFDYMDDGAFDYSNGETAHRSRAAFQRETVRRYNGGVEFKGNSIKTIRPRQTKPELIQYPNDVLAFDFEIKDGKFVHEKINVVESRRVTYNGLGNTAKFDPVHFGPKSEEPGVFVPKPPKRISFAPAGGPVGMQVTVTGRSFDGVLDVKVGDRSVPFKLDPSGERITFNIPDSGGGQVSVVTDEGTLTSGESLTVEQPGAPRVSVTARPGAVTVTRGQSASLDIGLDRVNFKGAVDLFAGGVPAGATATFNPDPAPGTSATLTISASAAAPVGTATLTIGGSANGTPVTPATVSLTVNSAPAPPPAITGFMPASGQVGSQVNVAGANFNGATALRFNGTNAQFTVLSPGMLRATVPAGATTGPLTLTTPGGSVTSPAAFTVLQPPPGGKGAKEKDGKETKEGKEQKDVKEKDRKEAKDKEIKEGKEDKEKEKEKERKETKEIKERKEIKDVGEALTFTDFPNAGDAPPAEGSGGPRLPPRGRAFITREERPEVGRRILRGEETEGGEETEQE